MRKIRNARARKVAVLATMGMLLQAGGCTFDPYGLVQNMLASSLTTVSSGWVCDAVFPDGMCQTGGGFF